MSNLSKVNCVKIQSADGQIREFTPDVAKKFDDARYALNQMESLSPEDFAQAITNPISVSISAEQLELLGSYYSESLSIKIRTQDNQVRELPLSIAKKFEVLRSILSDYEEMGLEMFVVLVLEAIPVNISAFCFDLISAYYINPPDHERKLPEVPEQDSEVETFPDLKPYDEDQDLGLPHYGIILVQDPETPEKKNLSLTILDEFGKPETDEEKRKVQAPRAVLINTIIDETGAPIYSTKDEIRKTKNEKGEDIQELVRVQDKIQGPYGTAGVKYFLTAVTDADGKYQVNEKGEQVFAETRIPVKKTDEFYIWRFNFDWDEAWREYTNSDLTKSEKDFMIKHAPTQVVETLKLKDAMVAGELTAEQAQQCAQLLELYLKLSNACTIIGDESLRHYFGKFFSHFFLVGVSDAVVRQVFNDCRYQQLCSLDDPDVYLPKSPLLV